MAGEREFLESPWEQGEDEIIAYIVDISTWPGTGAITGIVVVLKDEAGADVSATKLTGSNSSSDVANTITTKQVMLLAPGVEYRLEVMWVRSGNTLEGWGAIRGRV